MTITNSGAVNGTAYALYGSGFSGVNNIINPGNLRGTDFGAVLNYSAALRNYSNITGGLAGVYLNYNAGLINAGHIIGGTIGMLANNVTTLPSSNSGLISGAIVLRFLANRYRADLRKAGLGSGRHSFELALPALDGPLTLRRVADGALLDQGWMATRRAG